MRLSEIKQFVQGTSDAAFAVNGEECIVAWNDAATELFGKTEADALGLFCGEIVQGKDECGLVCHEDCLVKQAAAKRHSMSNFDLQVNTTKGLKWCNLSVVIVENARSLVPYTIHILRVIDSRKRFEILVRDFVISETSLPPEQAQQLLTATRSVARCAELTKREREILILAAQGMKSSAIADQLHISYATVDNHFQHILKKLNAHSRLEAIRKAQFAKLI